MNTPAQTATVTAICASLADGERLIEQMDRQFYGTPRPDLGCDRPGAHIRHHLDHVTLLLDGLQDGLVDYDARARDTRIETDPDQAIAASAALRRRLEALDAAQIDQPLRICQRTTAGGRDRPTATTSLGRELLFLHSHAVHHYALLGILLRAAGVWIEGDMGVMPATLAHRQATAGSA